MPPPLVLAAAAACIAMFLCAAADARKTSEPLRCPPGEDCLSRMTASYMIRTPAAEQGQADCVQNAGDSCMSDATAVCTAGTTVAGSFVFEKLPATKGVSYCGATHPENGTVSEAALKETYGMVWRITPVVDDNPDTQYTLYIGGDRLRAVRLFHSRDTTYSLHRADGACVLFSGDAGRTRSQWSAAPAANQKPLGLDVCGGCDSLVLRMCVRQVVMLRLPQR